MCVLTSGDYHTPTIADKEGSSRTIKCLAGLCIPLVMEYPDTSRPAFSSPLPYQSVILAGAYMPIASHAMRFTDMLLTPKVNLANRGQFGQLSTSR